VRAKRSPSLAAFTSVTRTRLAAVGTLYKRGRNPNQGIGPATRFERLCAAPAEGILRLRRTTSVTARLHPLSSESEIMTIATLDSTLPDPDSHIRTHAVERRKLLTAMSAVAFSGAASNLLGRGAGAEAAEPAPAIAPRHRAVDMRL
jgi:hypothetical protein